MPIEIKPEKAYLTEVQWSKDGQVSVVDENKKVYVQFNPESLKVAFSNQKAGGDQKGGSAIQFVGKGNTKLSLDLVFDVDHPLHKETASPDGDVRKLTKEVAFFITPKGKGPKKDQYIPPGVRFVWGSFLFDGIMDSLNENLTYFSPQGKPLRATVSINLSQQEIQFQFNPSSPPPAGTDQAGTQPLTQAKQGDSVQQMASRDGKSKDWPTIADKNNIDNPRNLPPGKAVNLNPK